jgi:peptidoglycan/LPS O-acetylase OafA/YrhL
MAATVLTGAARGELPWEARGLGGWLLGQLRVALFGPGVRGHLWYLYVAIALTLAVWLIRNAHVGTAVTRRQLVIPALALFLPFGLAEAMGRTMTWGTFGWAIAYAALGVVVLEMGARRCVGALMLVAASIAMIVLTDIVGFDTWPTAQPSPIRLVAGVGLAWLLTGLPSHPRLRDAAVRLGALSFGVYLAHILVLAVLRVPTLAATRATGLPEAAFLPILLPAVILVTFGAVAAWHRSPRLARLLG